MTLRLAAAPLLVAILACGGGTGGPADTSSTSGEQDVRGVYAVEWSDQLTIRLDIGGAVQEVTAGPDEVVTFNAPDGSPLEIDLAAYCADPGVVCPSEAWPANVAIDEDSPEVTSDLHTLRAWDADAPGSVVSGAVDHRSDQLLFGLDGASGGSSNCAALAISLAGGTFAYPGVDTSDSGAGAGVTNGAGGPDGIVDGGVAIGWAGVCAWSGLAVAATLSIETPYEATRVGDLP